MFSKDSILTFELFTCVAVYFSIIVTENLLALLLPRKDDNVFFYPCCFSVSDHDIKKITSKEVQYQFIHPLNSLIITVLLTLTSSLKFEILLNWNSIYLPADINNRLYNDWQNYSNWYQIKYKAVHQYGDEAVLVWKLNYKLTATLG